MLFEISLEIMKPWLLLLENILDGGEFSVDVLIIQIPVRGDDVIQISQNEERFELPSFQKLLVALRCSLQALDERFLVRFPYLYHFIRGAA